MRYLSLCAATVGALAVCCLAPVYARPVNISVGASTLGFGVQVATPIVPGTLDIALGINHFSYNRSGTYTKNNSAIPYNGTLRLQTIPVLLDYFPFHGVFRLTGGVMVNQNDFNLVANGGNGTYEIDGYQYTASGDSTFTEQVKWRRFAPYLGIGWGSKAARHTGFSMGFDLGVLYTDSPAVTMSASGYVPAAGAPTLQTAVAAEQAKANQSASSLRFWPMIGIRVGYDF